MSAGKGSRPDIVILNRQVQKIALNELTIPLERNAQKAHNRKELAYTELQLALKNKGYQCFLTPFQAGKSGHITRNNKDKLDNILHAYQVK